MTDELSAPLGKKRKAKGKPGVWTPSTWPLARIGFALLVLIGIGATSWAIFVDDPLGGRPFAEVPLHAAPAPNPLEAELSTPVPAPSPTPGAAAPGANRPVDGPSIITLDAEGRVIGSGPLSDAPMEGGPLPELLEETQHGAIPRIGPTGTAPYAAYARPSVGLSGANGRALVAVLMTGLGLSETGTLDAINTLPGNVTLAFAPYGDDLERLAGIARAQGFEIMLQIPLEPFDYPQNDPGPHTLLVEQPPRANLEKLFWLMARFGGYTGVVNHMGARFSASTADFAPVMEELGLRGLAYLDDGSSNRSTAEQIARENAVPFARAERELDTNPSADAIRAELRALEARAGERGFAIGTISALPVSIRTLTEWANALDETTTLLVPVSALATRPQQ